MKAKRLRLIDRLDRVFSEWIRERDSHDGIFNCISCSLDKPIEQADCGHYHPRKNMGTRFDEKNCNAQCRHCNRFMMNDPLTIVTFKDNLIKKYGPDIIEELVTKRHQLVKYSIEELEEMIKKYKEI